MVVEPVSKQTYEYFLDAGIKVETTQFLVCSMYHNENIELTSSEAVRLTDMPTWDIYEIMDMLHEDDQKRFNELLLKAVQKSHTCA
jgi:Fe-S-cluster formation regulator IscX/YfhJ